MNTVGENGGSTTTSPIIQARGLSKRYGDKQALDQIDLSVEPGRIVGLIGPNGAGKTTLIKALLGMTPVDGQLQVAGLDPRRQRARLMERVSYIADVAVLPRWITAGQLMEFVEGVHPGFDRAQALRLLARTEVKPEQKVRQLSKGMLAQLHLAVVMAIDAQLLVLDEPTLGLDILYRKAFYDTLIHEYHDEQRSILITTHQVEEIEHLLTDVIFIRQGRILLQASMDTLATRFSTLVCPPDRRERALALGPVQEKSLLGKSVYLYDGVERTRLAELGEVHTPGLADLFVALMQEKT